jgi:hypothetical protein
MSKHTEVVLHWAAAVNTVMLGLLAFFPQAARQVPVIGPPWSYLFGASFGVTPEAGVRQRRNYGSLQVPYVWLPPQVLQGSWSRQPHWP